MQKYITSMARVKNPFIVTGKIEPTYFCDRIEESARLVKSITNGNNMVIISPRRMGKTGLIQFCYIESSGIHLSAGAGNIRNLVASKQENDQTISSNH
mgnify:CR=1 FL=1